MIREILQNIVSCIRLKTISDIEPTDRELMDAVGAYIMTCPKRVYALICADHHIVNHGIEGSIVEAGVCKCGPMLAVAKTLIANDAHDRRFNPYDAFDGMVSLTTDDASFAVLPYSIT